MISLKDDGSLDTVFVCSECVGEIRYNFQYSDFATYEEFLGWAKEDAKEWCDCNLGGDYKLT